MVEAELYSEICIAAAKLGVRLYRNNVGTFRSQDKGSRWIRTGLCPGSSDLVGMRTVQVRGSQVAQFVAIEVKVPGKSPKKHQRDFLAMVNDAGGLAGCVHSVEEAETLLKLPSPCGVQPYGFPSK